MTTCRAWYCRSWISGSAGCRHWFDSLSDKSIPVCETGSQFATLTRLTLDFSLKDLSGVRNVTGCQIPCRYTEYKQVGDLEVTRSTDRKRTLMLTLADTNIKLVNEEKLYGFVSFLAEFGGALGLFVGWSLLSVLDLADVLRKYLPQFKR